MSTLQEIKAAIPKLTLEERAEVARCLHQWEDDEWDEQMKRDAAEDKLKSLLKKVDSDIAQGNLSDLP
jgi:ribosome recycling factor